MGAIYLTLKREYEISKIEEMKNMPIINVLDIAIPPALKSGPKRAQSLIITFILTFSVAVLIVLGEAYYNNMKADTDFQEVSSEMKENFMSDIGNMKKFFGKTETREHSETEL